MKLGNFVRVALPGRTKLLPSPTNHVRSPNFIVSGQIVQHSIDEIPPNGASVLVPPTSSAFCRVQHVSSMW